MINFQSEEEFNQYLKQGKHLGYGKDGKCFLIKNQVWKVYYASKAIEYGQNLDDLTKFSDVHVKGFSFIRDVVLLGEEKKFVSSVSDYASGKDLLKTKLYLCQFAKIIKGLKSLESSVIELSELGIVIDDLFPGNMLYDDGTFKCIDTDSYHYSDKDASLIYLSNMRFITKSIMEAIFRGPYLEPFITKISKYHNYNRNRDLITDPIYLLRLLKTELEDICGRELQKFASANKSLAQLLKK